MDILSSGTSPLLIVRRHNASRRAAALYAKYVTNKQKPAQRGGSRPGGSGLSLDIVRIKVANLSIAGDFVRSNQGNGSGNTPVEYNTLVIVEYLL